jgi:hypothetical protein
VKHLADIVFIALLILYAGMFATLGYRMLTGSIVLSGMLEDHDHPGVLSLPKLQLLVVTLFGASTYLGLTLAMPATLTTTFPEVPPSLLTVIGGSGIVSLLGQRASVPLSRSVRSWLRRF